MRPARVVLIGPECTGKTRLAQDLAALYAVPWAPEHARADVDEIGRGQMAGEDQVMTQGALEGAPFVLLDTDLVSTMVYSRHYYDNCPYWIEAEAVRRLGDLYLLHSIDVEWQADGPQREQPERREELFVRFRLTLQLLEARVAEIAGDWDERRRRAVAAIVGLTGVAARSGR